MSNQDLSQTTCGGCTGCGSTSTNSCVEEKVFAVLAELNEALQNLLETGETYTIFLGTCGLTEPEQERLVELLGEGEISISYETPGSESVEWKETAISGIWLGKFYNVSDEMTARTVEVALSPTLIQADPYDISLSREKLQGIIH